MNRKKRIIAVIIIITMLFTNIIAFADVHDGNEVYKQLIIEKIEQYKEDGINYKHRLIEYNEICDYFNYGLTKNYRASDTMQLDNDGIPKVLGENGFYYNPVTVSQYCLSVYGKYLIGTNTLEDFIKAADKLVSLQDESGAFRYQSSFKYYLSGQMIESGWVSGMAQGQAISVLTRAYHVTKDIKYLESAKRAFEFLITPIEQGGTMGTLADLDPLLDDYIIFEEYISKPQSYTLNGFMFTLIGLYDYTQLDNISYQESINTAKAYFYKGIESLNKLLPLYDLGGFTAYDLGYITYGRKPHLVPRYHAVHIQLLYGLYSVTLYDQLLRYAQKWAFYIDDPQNVYKIVKPISADKEYIDLLNKFPIEKQGYSLERGMKEKTEQPMTYALVLSSESLRYKAVKNEESEKRIRNAAKWIIENSDLNKDGNPGWGLPQPFDAFADGTTNPENHPYTITTAIVIESLLDALSIKDFWTEAEKKQIKDLISDVTLYWLKNIYVGGENMGCLGYSQEITDMYYYTPNVSGMFLSGLVRILTEHNEIFDETQKTFVTQRTHSIAKKLTSTVILNDGIPYWHYVVNPDKANSPRPNDPVHHIYILWGIEEYRDHFNEIAIPFSRNDSIASVDSFLRGCKIYHFPQNQIYTGADEQFNERPANLWGVGMVLAFYAKYDGYKKTNNISKIIDNNYGPIPDLTMWSMDFSKDDEFYERYAAHVLFGLAHKDFYNKSSEF